MADGLGVIALAQYRFVMAIGARYEGSLLSLDLLAYSAFLLAGLAITTLPIEKRSASL
ncbi:hypothetical protein [Pseudomonas sp.]|uniref:hypothetical protein n=1 Tax=Pseudomonas sp. TaxID=306 RepID=UPI0040542AF3